MAISIFQYGKTERKFQNILLNGDKMDDFDFISALNSFNEKYLPKILIFLLVFVVGSLIVKLLLKLIRKIIDKSKIERTVITFFFSIL